jgi:hypothetical protein
MPPEQSRHPSALEERHPVNAVESLPRRLLLGGAVGAAVGAAVWLLTGAFDSRVFSFTYAAAFSLGAAGVCALARLAFRRSLGPVIGLLLGFLLGLAGGQAPAASDARARGEDVERSARQTLPVPTAAWALAAFGALAAAFFQRGAEAGAGRT